MREPVQISRIDLYEMIWEKPVTKIALELGISDVAVGKICKKLNIPKPGLGYWAKLRHGKKVRQTPLPDIVEGDPETYTIKGSMDANLNLSTSLIEKQKGYEANPSNKITVNNVLRNPHPLIHQTLHRKKVRDSASLHEWENLPPGVNISVSDDSYSRALRIMDALIKGLEKRGHVVRATRGYGGYTAVTIEGEELKFDIFEFSRKIQNPKHSEYSNSSQTILEPTGRLSLRIQDFYWGRKTVSDGKVKQLEDRLNKFVLILVEASEVLKIHRKERAEREHERQLQAEKEREEAQRRRLEQEQIDQLYKYSEAWRRHLSAKEYVSAIKKINSRLSIDWIHWVEDHLEKVESRLLNPKLLGSNPMDRN